ncbi:amidohydrolase family protein [Agrobacterium vitis]|uniref:Amidohydrolase family protein n=1 Tax=Agrobacterium vitis TaxID=373 RepID=A0AAE2UVP3_AGRVI|nr:amidohydrolase family protein [Agrobacterium vitis]
MPFDLDVIIQPGTPDAPFQSLRRHPVPSSSTSTEGTSHRQNSHTTSLPKGAASSRNKGATISRNGGARSFRNQGADCLGICIPTVIDHYGLYGQARPSDEKGRALLRLLEAEHIWVKLSSPYRRPDRPLNIEPDPDWLSALIDRCPSRCVWGSDWPHPPPHESHFGPDVPSRGARYLVRVLWSDLLKPSARRIRSKISCGKIPPISTGFPHVFVDDPSTRK